MILKFDLNIFNCNKWLFGERVRMNGHIINSRFINWPKVFGIDRQFFQFIQSVHSVDNSIEIKE
jgi:hypothetical protein